MEKNIFSWILGIFNEKLTKFERILKNKPEWHKTDYRKEFRPWTGVTLA